MTNNTRKKLAIVLIILSIVLMIINFVNIDYSNFDYKDFFGPLSNILLIIAMGVTLKEIKKNKQ